MYLRLRIACRLGLLGPLLRLQAWAERHDAALRRERIAPRRLATRL
jgi:hypothetical protein